MNFQIVLTNQYNELSRKNFLNKKNQFSNITFIALFNLGRIQNKCFCESFNAIHIFLRTFKSQYNKLLYFCCNFFILFINNTIVNKEKMIEITKIKPTNYVYNKKQMIGKGSFGQVYLGYNQKEHFPVAVKIISFEKISALMDKQSLLSKLKQEIINMQIAKNQNLVQLLDVQVSSRNFYIICEYCNGQSFDMFLRRKGYLTQNQALTFFKQILRGFQNLHSKKIVHRDLKPANLLIHNFNIKIADLGFSKAIEQHEQLLQSIVGTPLYMSPQIFNKQKYTEKTDIWSLGIILYEMLYGRIPWKAKSIMQLKQKVENHAVQFPSSPIVTANTKHLIHSMLQLQQKKRLSWQQLFSSYIPPLGSQSNTHPQELDNKSSQMLEQKHQQYQQNFTKLFQYINCSSYIQSQNQLIKVLMDLKIRTKQQIDMDSSFQKAQQFFTSKLFLSQKKLQVLSYCFYFFARRNRITYLFRIFDYLYQILNYIEQRQTNLSAALLSNILATQLLIVKFSIHSLFKIINRNIDTEQQRKIAQLVESGPCPYPKYIEFLLKHDFQSFWQFFDIFKSQCFEKRMKTLQSINISLYNQTNKQLSGLYNNEIGDYKFVKFMLGNSLRSVFNELKNIQPKTQQIIITTRMIYQFQKDKQIFQLGDLLQTYRSQKNPNTISIINVHDLHKKFNQWRNDSNWKSKLSQISTMKIQSLNSFISKEFKWNPLHVYATDILK